MFKHFSILLAIASVIASSLNHALAAPVEELKARQPCADVMVFYARGTTEPAPIGSSTSVGADLQSNLMAVLGSRSLSFQGVDYPADIPGFLEGGDPQGSRNMANDLTNAANACPNAKLVSSGYSQGGQLVHNSAAMLSSAVLNRINAVVIFGDPDRDRPIAGIPSNRIDIICHVGDNICDGGDLILPPHLDYQLNVPAAAQFIASLV
ncbi:hypothetical protein VKT23_007765 [Stygiomarasmius scandens]|uniref:Cutinase n=1 Tax=Marasmiellus scandens TaxID=2682957 RepID=A0ABR1JIY4_9AGAR